MPRPCITPLGPQDPEYPPIRREFRYHHFITTEWGRDAEGGLYWRLYRKRASGVNDHESTGWVRFHDNEDNNSLLLAVGDRRFVAASSYDPASISEEPSTPIEIVFGDAVNLE